MNMRNLKQITLAIATMIVTAPAFAIYCPNNFNTINIGDTIGQVKQQCGNPIAEKDSESTNQLPQEWVYYVKFSPPNQATLKMTMAFINGKLANMSVNGAGVTETSICGTPSQIGDTEETVTKACGKPAFINQGTGPQQLAQPANNATKIVELTYQTNLSNVTLVFKDGKFSEKK